MKLIKRIQILCLSIFISANCWSQALPFTEKAVVLTFDPKTNKLKVDMEDDLEGFNKELPIESSTIIKDKKGNNVSASSLRAGTELVLEGNTVNYQKKVDVIIVTKPWTGGDCKIDGVLEQYDPNGDYAVIAGERLKLDNGVEIKGKDEFKGQSFKNFSSITLGYQLTARGVRGKDGYIQVSDIDVTPNTYSKSDKELKKELDRQYSSNNISEVEMPQEHRNLSRSLRKGYAEFGTTKLKLSDNIYLQAYVTSIGNKLIPSYMQNIPDNAPEKIKFSFIVIESPMYNAFALPNGTIFINTGLLAELENEDQLAAIISHEISHVIYKHAQHKYELQKKIKESIKIAYIAWKIKQGKLPGKNDDDIEIISLIVSHSIQGNIKDAAKEAAPLFPIISKLPSSTKESMLGLLHSISGLASNNNGADDERDADKVGLFYMQQGGYNPHEAAKIWLNFMNKTSDKTISDRINTVASDWVVKSNLSNTDNPISTIGDMVISKLINAATDNWFSNYPKAKERYRNINKLVMAYYADNTSPSNPKTQEYKKALNAAKSIKYENINN